MSTPPVAPPPAPSPVPKDELGKDPSPSGSWKTPTVHEVLAIADVVTEQAIAKVTGKTDQTAKSTRLQWVGLSILGAFTVGSGVFMAWCLSVVLGLGTAQAQTKATADAARDGLVTNAARIEAVDSGTREEISALRKEIAGDREDTRKQLTDMQITMQAVLREVKKK